MQIRIGKKKQFHWYDNTSIIAVFIVVLFCGYAPMTEAGSIRLPIRHSDEGESLRTNQESLCWGN